MRRTSLALLLSCLAAACGPAPATQSPSAPGPTNDGALVAPETSAPAAGEEAPVAIHEATPPPSNDAEAEIREVPVPGVTAEAAQPEATAEPSKPQPPPSDVPGANMHVSRVTTDGVTIENVDCRSEGGGLGGLLGTLVIGKPFADRKGRLDRCVQGLHKTRVRWTAAGGKMSGVKVISGDSPANACIERALDGALATVSGECAASVEIGK